MVERLEGAEPGLARDISPITDHDFELVKSFLKRSVDKSIKENRIKFEDSFEYIRLYFNSGGYQGYKFYDQDNDVLLLFAIEGKKRPRVKLYKPLGEGEGLLIVPCSSIHTHFMGFPIDVVYVDREQKVVAVDEEIVPWRFGRLRRGVHFVIELAAGSARVTGTEAGDQLQVHGYEI